MKLSIIMACHNRRELTLDCVNTARSAAALAGAEVSFTIFDDGSTDGTREAVASLPIAAQILSGTGSAFWANGMAQAESYVLQNTNTSGNEFIVWLNDDVKLDDDAFKRVLQSTANFPSSVIVGAVRDPFGGEVTYSGMRRAGFHPLKFAMVAPSDEVQEVHTFNGNFVVVPIDIARALGGIDGSFQHALADIDYGLRCKRAGVPVILAPGTYGTCSRNVMPPHGRLKDDWNAFIGRKGGGNYHSLRRVLRKSHPGVWPFFVSVTYILWWTRRFGKVARCRMAPR